MMGRTGTGRVTEATLVGGYPAEWSDADALDDLATARRHRQWAFSPSTESGGSLATDRICVRLPGSVDRAVSGLDGDTCMA